jgi:hypothetical protein
MGSVKTLSKWQKRDCDRCGFTFYKHELIRDKGLLVCKPCVDGPYQNSKVPWRFGGKQPAGVWPITTVNASLTCTNEYMQLVGAGAVSITGANIVAGSSNQVVTLEGTSNLNTITFTDDTTLNLWEGKQFILGNGDVLCLVYSSGVWTETSRSKYNY